MVEQGNEVIWRQDLQAKCDVTSETIRRWLKEKRLPEPDVAITRRKMGWRRSTLIAAGINL